MANTTAHQRLILKEKISGRFLITLEVPILVEIFDICLVTQPHVFQTKTTFEEMFVCPAHLSKGMTPLGSFVKDFMWRKSVQHGG
jgi:hypothetical protein